MPTTVTYPPAAAARARDQIFLVLLARGAQMRVHVDEAGKDATSAQLVENRGAGRHLQPVAHGGDRACCDQKVAGCVGVATGEEGVHAREEQVLWSRCPAREPRAEAMR